LQNIPIAQKMMLVLGLLGLFVLGISYYAAGQMRLISSSYSGLMAGNDQAALFASRANRAFAATRADVADLLIATSAVDNAIAKGALDNDMTQFVQHMGEAVRASPGYAGPIMILKARALNVLNNQCAKTIAMGSNTAISASDAQSEYRNNCEPEFGRSRLG
jgi:methyl-accepting chemotaxis protein